MSAVLDLSAGALHEKAVRLASEFRRLESSLAQCLGEVEETRLYFELGYPSLFQYATHALGLTESVAYALITVARTMKQVPELRAEIESGRLSVFKGKKICSVLKKDESSQEVRALNQEWIEKAKRASAQKAKQERTAQTHVKEDQARDPDESETLSDSMKPDDTTLIHLQVIRTASSGIEPKNGRRRSLIPSALLHEVHLRDQKRCQHADPAGRLCGESRFTEIHHVRPLHMGGMDELSNLITICKLCRMRHNRHYAESQIMPSAGWIFEFIV